MSKESPPKETVLAARQAANMTQEAAAELVHLSSFTRWSEYERGKRDCDPARFELFLIKSGQHPEFGPRRRVKTSARK